MQPNEAVAFALDRGLVDRRAIVAGDLEVQSRSSRNRNQALVSRDRPSIFLKQGEGRDGLGTVTHEAAIYRLLHRQAPALTSYLPELHLFDTDTNTLAIECIVEAEGLAAYHRRLGRFPNSVAARLAQALAALHAMDLDRAPGSATPEAPPWALSLFCPRLEAFRDFSAGSVQLTGMIQSEPRLEELLRELRGAWQPRALIHADIKWPNLLLSDRAQPLDRRRLVLVDWEMARIGDPGWDLGSVICDYLGFWLRSIPVSGDLPPEELVRLARYPLDRMQPALRRFWSTYVELMALSDLEADRWLARSCRYAAVRLLQTAFEQTQEIPEVTGDVVCMLQLAVNMLRQPLMAAIQLLGIPVRAVSPLV